MYLLANQPVISSSNVVGFQQAGGSLTRIPIIKTETSLDPFSTSAGPGRRTVVHKCHIFHKNSTNNFASLNATPCNAVSSVASKPGLLKSLLECGSRIDEGDRTLALSTIVATPLSPKESSNATKLVASASQPPVMSTGFHSDQAHHSRGTWQVGGRAIVLDVSLKKSSVAIPLIPQQGIVPQAVSEVSYYYSSFDVLSFRFFCLIIS